MAKEIKQDTFESLLLQSQGSITENEVIKTDYDYWRSQEPLEGSQIRNIKGNIAAWTLDRASGATWTQQIKGIWFKPKLVRIEATIWASNWSISIGQAFWTTQVTIYMEGSSSNYVTDLIIRLVTSSWNWKAEFVQFLPDGFEINWTQITQTTRFNYQCFA